MSNLIELTKLPDGWFKDKEDPTKLKPCPLPQGLWIQALKAVGNKLRFNFQMTDLQAAIGREQLKKLPGFIKQREKWFKIYHEIGLNLIDSKFQNHTPVRYRIVHKCKNPREIIDELFKEKIKAIVPIEEFELLDKNNIYLNAHSLSISTVSLPAHLNLKEEDIIRIGSIVKSKAIL